MLQNEKECIGTSKPHREISQKKHANWINIKKLKNSKPF